MTGRRWWDVLFGGTVIVLAAINVVAWAPSEWQRVGVWVILGLLAVAYFVLGRRALADNSTSLPFAIVLIAASGALVACSPNMAVVQAITFPLMWSIISSTRLSIVANVALAIAVFVGFLFVAGIGVDSVVQAALIEGISLVGSLALGLWITSIAHLSHERKQLLDELTAAQDKLATLHREGGVASERERLAREIHDTIAQDLTGLVMLTQRARRELSAGNAPLADQQLELLEDNARTALAETRALVASAAPVGLTSGITEALQRLAERFSRETGVTVGVEVGTLPALERDTEVVLLRIAQEGLANIRKHAGAESAVIELRLVDGKPTLAVRDNGTGFDLAASTGGFGLSGMRDRLSLVGGSLDVASSPTGTTLTATLPASVNS
ncbi:MAG: sensor histidine kinase [Rhodoglobus sp.]